MSTIIELFEEIEDKLPKRPCVSCFYRMLDGKEALHTKCAENARKRTQAALDYVLANQDRLSEEVRNSTY